MIPRIWALILTTLAPSAVHAQESPFLEHPMDVRYDVRVPMRDGVELSADVYRPLAEGPWPVVLKHTPFGNNHAGVVAEAFRFVARGYTFVEVDVRGRFDSDGEFTPLLNDGLDGSDLIGWVAEQPWCDGRVVTFGDSYLGFTQWLTARESEPRHRAILSRVAPADGFRDVVRWNGIPKFDWLFPIVMQMTRRTVEPGDGWDWHRVMRQLPLDQLDGRVGRDNAAWRAFMEHDRLDDFWKRLEITGFYDRFDLPSFNVTGWWDGDRWGQIRHFENAVATASDPSDHKLVVGPWPHDTRMPVESLGELHFGPDATIDVADMEDRWLDHHLLGAPDPEIPNVQYFVQGRNEWRAAEAWPIPGTRFVPWYLSSGGAANTLDGDGELVGEPRGDEPADELVYDPADPVPSGPWMLPDDNRELERREDVLVYTAAPLEEELEVTGPVEAVVFFSTDVLDTDIAVKLLDVYPDGRAIDVSLGIARARYRDSFEEPSLLEPGRAYELSVRMYPTSYVFAHGHRLRVEVTSSCFPAFSRNLNTGANNETTSETKVARTRILHDADNPSRLVLPVPGPAAP